MASFSSSAPRNNKKMHDVFLSFRGEDTRNNFTSHLHSALIQKGIITFIDNDLKRGDDISQSLLDTIEASSISIIIFSEGYASSGWCLDELLKILDCMHDHGQIVMPVFYHVDPSHVRWQSQDFSFGKHFSGLQERYQNKMERWKNALTEAANLSGFDSNVIRPDSKLIEEIANEVLKSLVDETLFPSENKDLVGLECAIKEIESSLCIGSAPGVCKLGIWGIGGIGKTAIADAVFNRISRRFKGSYFARNVREVEETGGINDLQKELLSDLLNDINVRKKDVQSHLSRLACKQVLIVFDDVSDWRQLEFLIGRLDDLASGSRVIITTRDKHVLQNCSVNQTHQLKELADVDAQKLFCRCAFRQGHPDASYTDLIRKALKYAQGVPLALKVLGSYLCGCSKEEWESGMRKLETVPHQEIQEVLKISFGSLDDAQKEIFLDIACLLEGESRNEVVRFLCACDFSPEIELRVLQNKSLITVDHRKRIRMHDLLRHMGREIVRKESIDDPRKRSRLWRHKDICEVLTKNSGTEAVKGIALNMSNFSGEIHMSPYAFAKMPKLRFLKLYGYTNKCMVSRLKGVSFAKLRYLEWVDCPLKMLNISAENLVSLKMRGSKVEQLWDDVQNLVNLKGIDLGESESLTKLPDFSRAQNLEIMSLDCCLSLTETHSSIQYLNKLEVFYLRKCESLMSLPTSIHSKHLKEFEISNCSKLKNFPEISSSHIDHLELTRVGIKELPSSIECLSKLRSLRISNCSRLESISSSIFKLESLNFIEISNHSNLKGFPEISSCNTDGSTGIEQLSPSMLTMRNCTALESLPSSLCMLKSLTLLEIIDCPKFERLPDELGNLKALNQLSVEGVAIREIPESLGQLALLYELRLRNCTTLESLPNSLCMLKSLTSLKIIACKNFKRLPDEVGNLKALKQLSVEGTAIREIPESLGQLSSLEDMNLSDNRNLQKIPESIRHLSKLTRLKTGNCERLQTLPKLPRNLDLLDASGCTSLAGLSSIALNLYAHSYECLKLENEQSLFHRERGIIKSMYFPRNEIPEWFKYQNTGSSIKKMPPPPAGYNKLIGFSFCVVVTFSVREHHHRKTSLYVYDAGIDLSVCLGSKEHCYRLGTISYVESDHVFLGSYLVNEGYGEEIDPGYSNVSFYVRGGREDCEVKKCGIHLVYAQDSTKPTEEEEKPHPKRLKSSSTPSKRAPFGQKIFL